MVTINDYLDKIIEASAVDRLATLMRGSDVLLSSMQRVDDKGSVDIHQPGRVYSAGDGLEFFLAWGNAPQHLVAGENTIALFQIYLSNQHLLFTYYLGGIAPTLEDIENYKG